MSHDFDNLRILVVEDLLPMRKLICQLIKSIGINNVMSAENGEDGYKQFCKEAPDIVVTDWEMKPVNGLELLQRIRQNDDSPNRETPVIMLTVHNAIERVNIARDAGVTEFLIKPFTAQKISDRIAHVIQNPRPFIAGETYTGPCRRRRINPNYSGPFRRVSDK